MGACTLVRSAHHESGHIVMFEWAGFEPVGATIDAHGGSAEFDPTGITASDDPDDDGTITASAAAIMHAGLAAELLFENIDPGNVLVTRDSDDWRKASIILAERFGPHSTGGHFFAQRLAMSVLSHRWQRVQQIATHLLKTGSWTP